MSATDPPRLAVDLGLALAGPLDAASEASRLAALGADGLFTFEGAHDVFFPLVLATTSTDVDLMTNVAMALPRSPLHLAYAANDLQLLSGGRFRLGIGSQIGPHVERRYGAGFHPPVARMREWTEATRMALRHFAGEVPFDFEGTYTSHTLMTPNFNPGPNPFGPPPVLVGALGPKMTAMAAEVADGVLVMPFNSAAHLRERTMPAIAAGLAAGGRVRSDIEVVAEVICAVGHTDAEIASSTDGARMLVAFYASTPAYEPVLEVHGWQDLGPRLRGLIRAGDWGALRDAVDDEVLGTIAAVGTPAQVGAEIVDRVGGIADRVAVYFPGGATDAAVADLVTQLHRHGAVATGSD